jgi:hypothetical protein
MSEYNAAWRAAHPDYMNEWNRAHPGYHRARHDRLMHDDSAPGVAHRAALHYKRAAQEANRNARLHDIPGRVTAAALRDLHAALSYTCPWCGSQSNEGWRLLHLRPMAGGGANAAENLTITCGACISSPPS